MVDLLVLLLLVMVEHQLSFGCHQKHYTIVMIQCEFSTLFDFFPSLICRSENVAIQPYDGPSVTVPLNHSYLFNAMIYPFTRIVIYGSIWYQGNNIILIYFIHVNILDYIHLGESNLG